MFAQLTVFPGVGAMLEVLLSRWENTTTSAT